MLTYLTSLLVVYKYIILAPAIFIDGPIFTMVAGFLARLGDLSMIISWIVITCVNLFSDVLLYWLGYAKGEQFVKRWGKYFGISNASIARVKAIFGRHHMWILLGSKVTNGFTMATVVLFTAGMSRVPFGRYMLVNFVGGSIFITAMLAFGYFFGHLYLAVDNVLSRIGLFVGVAVLIFLFVQAGRYLRHKI